MAFVKYEKVTKWLPKEALDMHKKIVAAAKASRDTKAAKVVKDKAVKNVSNGLGRG
jgi:hypothetical protein